MQVRDHHQLLEDKKSSLEKLKVLLAEYERPMVVANTGEIVGEILENYRYFYAIIARKIWTGLNPGMKKFNEVHFHGTVPDVFSKSLDILQEKYLSSGRISAYQDAKRVLGSICRIQTIRYMQEKIDLDFYARMKKQGVSRSMSLILRPPSYYYHKKYHEENKERINARRRARWAALEGADKKKELDRVKRYKKRRT